MKNWLYIPFLILMAVTYTRLSENYPGSSEESLMQISRAPASLEVGFGPECIDLPTIFNPHFKSQTCN